MAVILKSAKYLFSFLIAFYFICNLTGCKSTYEMEKYSSEKKYHEDFNSFASDKEITVIFKNKDKFTAEDGAVIKDNVMYSLSEVHNEELNVVPISLVKTILRSGYDYQQGEIILASNEKYNAKNILVREDSLSFTTTSEADIIKSIAPLGEIQTAGYKNHWLGVPFGAVTGMLAGGALGLVLIDVEEGHPKMGGTGENMVHSPLGGFLYGALSGAIIGGIIGWLTGYDYIYKF